MELNLLVLISYIRNQGGILNTVPSKTSTKTMTMTDNGQKTETNLKIISKEKLRTNPMLYWLLKNPHTRNVPLRQTVSIFNTPLQKLRTLRAPQILPQEY